MAPHANDLVAELPDRRGTFLESVLGLLGPRPGRLAFALRLALICALTTLVVEIYQTPDPALTVYVVFFLNKPDRVESLILSVVFTILITVVIGLVILMAMVVIDYPMWRVVLMTAFSFCFLFVAFASKLRPIAGIIALIVGYGLDLLGIAHLGEIATRGLLYAWLFVGIPAGVSAVVNLLIAPPPRRLAARALAERLRLAADMLRQPDERTRDAFTESLREGMDEIQTWLKLAGMEKTSPPRDIAALRQAMQSTTAILSWVDVMSRHTAAPLPGPRREQLAQTLEDMARVLMKGAYPVEISLEADNSDTALPAKSVEAWADMRDILTQFAEPPPPDPQPAKPAPQPSGFLLPDAFTNPEYVQYALKTTAAAMFCYILYSLLDWQSIHTCFITCYIVSLGTTAETIEKLSLRVLGCIIGAAVGIVAIVYVIPPLTSIGALLGVVFFGALASGWVAAGSPRISYAGFQIAFAFFLSVIQGPSPAFDLTIARDRTIGILLGNLAVYLLFTRAWPISVGRGVDRAITTVLRNLSAMTKTASRATRRSLAAQVQGALGGIEQNLHLAEYEPPTIRPNERWLRARRRAVHEIGALQGPLLMTIDREPARSADIARRLDTFANRLDETAKAPTDPGVEAFEAELNEALGLSQSPAPKGGNERTTSHVPT